MVFTYLNSITKTRSSSVLSPLFNTVATVPGTGYNGIAISKNGQYILVCKNLAVYLSSNYGVSFSTISTFSTTNNFACGISSDGQYMAVANSLGIYKSSNYGVNWSSVFSTGQSWTSLVLSANGLYCIAFGNVGSYISSDFTTTSSFSTKSVFASNTGNSGSAAISETGQYNVRVYDVGGTIAFSSDYGQNYLIYNNVTLGITGTAYRSITISYDGSIVYVTVYNDGLYKSTNMWSGGTPSFTKISSSTFTQQSWWGVTTSQNGRYIIATTDNYVYYSNNYGNNWTLVKSTLFFQVRMSDNAKYCIGRGTDFQVSIR